MNNIEEKNTFFVEYWVPVLESARFEGTSEEVSEFLRENPRPTFMDFIDRFGEVLDYEVIDSDTLDYDSLSVQVWDENEKQYRTSWEAEIGFLNSNTKIIPINGQQRTEDDNPGEEGSKHSDDEGMPQ